MATLVFNIKTTQVKTPGFGAVARLGRKNLAILGPKTAANIADTASVLAPVWHGTVNPGKGRVVGWSPNQRRLTPSAHSYPIPGHLAGSIHSNGSLVTVDAYYGIYVEFGTRFMHQEPFLRPACDLVWQTQFSHDVANLFNEDIGSNGSDSLTNSVKPAAITYHHNKHVEAKFRNRTRSVSQRHHEVRRRFTAMRTTGLHHSFGTVRI
jgi:HK97 gp10 family phage protein